MTYKLVFKTEAKAEWDELSRVAKKQFKKVLDRRLIEPKVPSAKLRGSSNRYKIKLRKLGLRMVYEVRDEELVVSVISVGKRDRNSVYEAADGR